MCAVHDQQGSQSKAYSSEWSVIKVLWRDIRGLRFSNGIIGVAAICVAVLLLVTDDEDAAKAVTIIGTVATLLALVVALAIFRWTQRQNTGQTDAIAELDGGIVGLGMEIGQITDLLQRGVELADSAEIEDGFDVPDVPAVSVLGPEIEVSGRRYRIVVDPLRNDAAWWRWMLGRIGDVADGSTQHSRSAAELLKTPLGQFGAIATLAESQRGNRRTLIVTETADGKLRVWSVFVGRGSHVKDVTREVIPGSV